MGVMFEIAPTCESESGLPYLIYSSSPTGRDHQVCQHLRIILHWLFFAVHLFSVQSKK